MGDFRGEDYHDKFVRSLVSFVAAEDFQTKFEDFFVTHALEFTNEAEHKLRYYELYTNFHRMFERQLEIFCDDQNLTQAEFMRRCREATTEDPKCRHYIDVLMSSVEYDTFVKLMRLMRPLAAMRLAAQADAKDDDSASSQAKAAKDAADTRSESKVAESKHADSKSTEHLSK